MSKFLTPWHPQQLASPKKPLSPQQLTPLTRVTPMKSFAPPPLEATVYTVWRGQQLVASFTKRSDAANWTRDISYHPDSEATYIISTDDGILCAYRDGKEIEYP